jgi:hypothetical protein
VTGNVPAVMANQEQVQENPTREKIPIAKATTDDQIHPLMKEGKDTEKTITDALNHLPLATEEKVSEKTIADALNHLPLATEEKVSEKTIADALNHLPLATEEKVSEKTIADVLNHLPLATEEKVSEKTIAHALNHLPLATEEKVSEKTIADALNHLPLATEEKVSEETIITQADTIKTLPSHLKERIQDQIIVRKVTVPTVNVPIQTNLTKEVVEVTGNRSQAMVPDRVNHGPTDLQDLPDTVKNQQETALVAMSAAQDLMAIKPGNLPIESHNRKIINPGNRKSNIQVMD